MPIVGYDYANAQILEAGDSSAIESQAFGAEAVRISVTGDIYYTIRAAGGDPFDESAAGADFMPAGSRFHELVNKDHVLSFKSATGEPLVVFVTPLLQEDDE
tara:strand:- start:1097 stop:1402 length:306 start_codon:yes stop_codon:yes gene_type:complete